MEGGPEFVLHQQGQNTSSEGPQGLCSALSLVGPVMILAGFPLVRGSQHSVVKGPPAFKTLPPCAIQNSSHKPLVAIYIGLDEKFVCWLEEQAARVCDT